MTLDRKRPLDASFLDAMKDRIEINEQIRRHSKLMQQAYLVARGKVKVDKMQTEAARTFMLGFKAVIGRFIPEQKAVEHTGEVIHRNAEELTDAELADIAQRGRERTSETPGSTH